VSRTRNQSRTPESNRKTEGWKISSSPHLTHCSTAPEKLATILCARRYPHSGSFVIIGLGTRPAWNTSPFLAIMAGTPHPHTHPPPSEVRHLRILRQHCFCELPNPSRGEDSDLFLNRLCSPFELPSRIYSVERSKLSHDRLFRDSWIDLANRNHSVHVSLWWHRTLIKVTENLNKKTELTNMSLFSWIILESVSSPRVVIHRSICDCESFHLYHFSVFACVFVKLSNFNVIFIHHTNAMHSRICFACCKVAGRVSMVASSYDVQAESP